MDNSLIRSAVQWARYNGKIPRVHPNGFIQLDVIEDDTRVVKQRLHVWPDNDDIPKQSVVTTIHDHRFDMRSTVLKGVLYQHVYAVSLTGKHPNSSDKEPFFSHEIFMARYPEGRKESQLMGTGVRVSVRRNSRNIVGTGQSYSQRRCSFHDTGWGGLTATLMEKSYEDLDHNPRVLVPLGEQPDNSFVRADVDPDLLWNYIERALT